MVCTLIINMPTNYVRNIVYKSAITNMVIVETFLVI